jgi:hypothetical protein
MYPFKLDSQVENLRGRGATLTLYIYIYILQQK